MKRLLLATLGWYREYRGLRPDACRFSPSCSAYAEEAVETHGPLKGFYFASRRVLRCHPLGGQGFDPVPGNTASKISQASPEIGPIPHA